MGGCSGIAYDLAVLRADEARLSGPGAGNHTGDTGSCVFHGLAPGLPLQPLLPRRTARQPLSRYRVRLMHASQARGACSRKHLAQDVSGQAKSDIDNNKMVKGSTSVHYACLHLLAPRASSVMRLPWVTCDP